MAWYIHPQDLIALVNLMETGRLDSMRTFTVAGSALKNRRYVQAMIGSPVEAMVQGEALGADVRCIAGGVLTGTKIESGYMGFYAHSLQVIPEGYQREFLRFMQPGFDRFSYSKVFLSNLFGPQEYPMTTSIQGEDRACVQCAACEDVCPVEILPQFLFKAALAEDYDNLDQLGIKDCVECGLCTFVCPSKIDVDGILKVTLAQIAKEG